MDMSNKWLMISVGLIIGILVGFGVGTAAYYHPVKNQSATILVLVQNFDYPEISKHYVVELNGVDYAQGDLLMDVSELVIINVTFPPGLETAQQVVTVTFTASGYSPYGYSQTVMVSNGGNYSIFFNG